MADRSLPWWLAGSSMVATTFAADTPLVVTGLVAMGGVAGNWVWWSWLIAHLVTALVFARSWRRLAVFTDAELMELRYDGPAAPALRAAKAFLQAILINVLVLGWVLLAMRKLSAQLFPDWDAEQLTLVLMLLGVGYSALGGMRSVVITDLLQLLLAAVGATVLAWKAMSAPEIGGLARLPQALETASPGRSDSLTALLPSGDLPELSLALLAVMLSVGWWRQAEGGGYIVQRLASTRSPRDAEQAGVLFAVLHNAVRPWPWILVGLAGLVFWPLGADCSLCPEPGVCTESLCQLDREASYPAMMRRFLSPGWLGLVIASLMAAFLSTLDTHVNWGSSYLVRDLWLRFLRPDAPPKEQLALGRVSALLIGLMAWMLSTRMDSIVEAWLVLVSLGSGLGSVALGRWLWWRVNAWAELSALLASLCLATLGVFMSAELDQAQRILLVALGSLAVWLPVTLLTPPESPEVLSRFRALARPHGLWGRVPGSPPSHSVLSRLGLGFAVALGTLTGIWGLLLRGPEWGLALLLAGTALWRLFRDRPEDGDDRGGGASLPAGHPL